MSGNNKLCFDCNEKIADRYTLVAIDGKYFNNLFFHKECLAKIENLQKYLEENAEKILKYR